MRTFLIKSSIILGLLSLLLATSGIAVVVYTPFRPGSLLFPLQDFGEQQASRIYRDPIQKANFMLDLVERRISDLNARTGSKHEFIALKYLDKAIDQASTVIALIPTDQAAQA